MMHSAPRYLLLCISAFLVFAAIGIVRQSGAPQPTLELALSVTRDTDDQVQIFVEGDEKHAARIRPGQQASITFNDQFAWTSTATIAIENSGCSLIRFQRVKFTSSSAALDYDAAQLKRLIGFYQAIDEEPQLGPSGLGVRSCANPARFAIALPAGHSGCAVCTARDRLFAAAASREGVFRSVALLFVTTLLALLIAHRHPAFFLLPLTFGLMVGAIAFSHRYIAPPDSIAVAVGRAGFVGASTTESIASIYIGALGALVVAILAAIATRRWRRRPGTSEMFQADPAPASSDLQRVTSILGIALLFGFLALFFSFPLLAQLLSSPFQYAPHWDSNNVLVWNYLAHEGFRPLRDFWYPYGGQALFALPAPIGELYNLSYRLVLQGLLIFTVWRLLGSWPRAAVVIIAIVALEQAGVSSHLYRYGLGVGIALSYVALLYRRAEPWTSLVFAAWLLLALKFEPIQVVYAAPALVLIKLTVVFGNGFSMRAIRKMDFSDVAVAGAAVAAYTLHLLAQGDLGDFLRFHSSLGSRTISSSVPTDIWSDLANWTSAQSAVLVMPVFLVAAGTYWLLVRPASDRLIPVTMIALGSVGLMIVQKHLLRDNRWEVLLPTTIAVLLLVLWRIPRAKAIEAIADGVCVGVLIFGLWGLGVLDRMAVQTSDAARLALNVARGEAVINIAEIRASRYAPERFAAFLPEREVLDQLRRLSSRSEIPSFYVIGDTPILYLLARQMPPFHFTDYDAPSISEQRGVARWLDQKKPEYAIWKPDDKLFDDIQRVVRNPIVYNDVIDTFVPVEDVGNFAILRRRAKAEPVALDWWREKIGSILEFGHLLRASRPGEVCADADAPECRDTLDIIVDTPPANPTRAVISFDIAGRMFSLAFLLMPNDRHYSLALHRLWFWNVAARNNLPHRIVGTSPSGYTIAIRREKTADRLY